MQGMKSGERPLERNTNAYFRPYPFVLGPMPGERRGFRQTSVMEHNRRGQIGQAGIRKTIPVLVACILREAGLARGVEVDDDVIRYIKERRLEGRLKDLMYVAVPLVGDDRFMHIRHVKKAQELLDGWATGAKREFGRLTPLERTIFRIVKNMEGAEKAIALLGLDPSTVEAKKKGGSNTMAFVEAVMKKFNEPWVNVNEATAAYFEGRLAKYGFPLSEKQRETILYVAMLFAKYGGEALVGPTNLNAAFSFFDSVSRTGVQNERIERGVMGMAERREGSREKAAGMLGISKDRIDERLRETG
ncbi:MAG: hypothetical protein NT157_00835 [Candidatus Micrarchaeota archaeon]|nr:hypothetical protein [Candidatus Micrarchaeota archaeon]